MKVWVILATLADINKKIVSECLLKEKLRVCKLHMLCTKQSGLHSRLMRTGMVFKGLLYHSGLGSSVESNGDPCRAADLKHTHRLSSLCRSCSRMLLSPVPDCMQNFPGQCVCVEAKLLNKYFPRFWRFSVTFLLYLCGRLQGLIMESVMQLKDMTGVGQS